MRAICSGFLESFIVKRLNCSASVLFGLSDCFLCRCAADSPDRRSTDRKNLVVYRGRHIVTVLNRYPYNNGHLLVASRRHEGRLEELSEAEWMETHPAAGAGVPDHLHWHIVPRWAGDVNFMTSLAGARVIPQSLDALWELLGEALLNQS